MATRQDSGSNATHENERPTDHNEDAIPEMTDSGANDRMRGQAIEVEQLIRACTQDCAHFGREAGHRPRAAGGKAGIERRLPPKRSCDDLQKQPTVARIFQIRTVLFEFPAECRPAPFKRDQHARRGQPCRHCRSGGTHRSKRSPGSTGRPFR